MLQSHGMQKEDVETKVKQRHKGKQRSRIKSQGETKALLNISKNPIFRSIRHW